MKKTRPVVIENTDAPVGRDMLAKTIVDISASMTRLLASGLNRRAIVILIHDESKISKRTIEYLLDSLEQLAEDYTR